MDRHITLLDGGAGTLLWNMAEREGISREPVWKYNIEHPGLVRELCRRYIGAGSMMIQTNTFSANRYTVQKDSDYTAAEVVGAAAEIAISEAAGRGVGVYASFGPLSQLLEPMGDLTEEEAADTYLELAQAAARAGVAMIVLETFMDARLARIAAETCRGTGLPVICSMTFSLNGRTLMGESVKDICQTLAGAGIDGIGMNCSYGPVEALEIIREYAGYTSLPLYFKPNSGMGAAYSAAQFAQEVRPALDFVSYIGGCCGTDESYIREIGKLL